MTDMDSETLVLIPARGGSRGIRDKNIRRLGGEPLINHTIEVALEANIGRVIVSTDDEVIAEASRRAGADVPFRRPDELASDTAGSLGVVLHALRATSGEVSEGMERSVCLLQPTSPLRSVDDVIGGWQMHLEEGQPVVGVERIQKPLAWMYRVSENREMQPRFPNEQATRRQEADELYMPNGALYIISEKELRAEQSLIPQGTLAWPMPAERSIDIDDELDWLQAETILRGELAEVRERLSEQAHLRDPEI